MWYAISITAVVVGSTVFTIIWLSHREHPQHAPVAEQHRPATIKAHRRYHYRTDSPIEMTRTSTPYRCSIPANYDTLNRREKRRAAKVRTALAKGSYSEYFN